MMPLRRADSNLGIFLIWFRGRSSLILQMRPKGIQDGNLAGENSKQDRQFRRSSTLL
jgi:hypothetical protein